MARKHVSENSLPEGIVSMDSNARFVGNAFDIDEWDRAMVWSPDEPTVEDNVSKELETDSASGKAPAVNGGKAIGVNKEVKGWNKWLLIR